MWCNSEMVRPSTKFVAKLSTLTYSLLSINDKEMPLLIEGTSQTIIGLVTNIDDYEPPPSLQIKELIDVCISRIKELTAAMIKQVPQCINLPAQRLAEYCANNNAFGLWINGHIPSNMIEYSSCA